MKWYSTKEFLPGDSYKPQEGYITPEFAIVYHHGDNELMTNIAWWNGERFIVGSLCYCRDCECNCDYHEDYSDECEVTHWMHIELPEFGMEIYDEDNIECDHDFVPCADQHEHCTRCDWVRVNIQAKIPEFNPTMSFQEQLNACIVRCDHESDGKQYGPMEWGALPTFKCKKCGEFYR